MLNLDARKWAIQNFPLLISEDLTDLEIMYRLLGEINRMSVRVDELPQEVQTAVNNWIIEHPEVFTIIADGTISEVKLDDTLIDKINYPMDVMEPRLEEAETNIKVNRNNIEANSARISEIVALPEGSTTGDAELMDIRIGANGTVYSTAGDAVRGQASQLAESITEILTRTDNVVYNVTSFGSVLSVADATISNSLIHGIFSPTGYVFVGSGSTNYLLRSGKKYRIVYKAETEAIGNAIPALVGVLNNVWKTSELFFNVGSKNTLYVFDVTPTMDISIGVRFDGNVQTTFDIELSAYDITGINENIISKIDFSNPNSIKSYSHTDYSLLSENTNHVNTWYKGKKFTSYGDSITEQNKWQPYVVTEFGVGKHVNCGWGGSHVGGLIEQHEAFKRSMWQTSRINTIPLDTDFMTFMGGTNDCNSWRTIGNASLENNDCTTFIGAYNVAISKLLYKFYNLENGFYSGIDYSDITKASEPKDVKIFLMSPPYNSNITYSGEYATRLQSFAEATKKVAEMWHLPYVPMFEACGINVLNENRYLSDTVHPNALGAKVMSSVVIGALKYFEPMN